MFLQVGCLTGALVRAGNMTATSNSNHQKIQRLTVE